MNCGRRLYLGLLLTPISAVCAVPTAQELATFYSQDTLTIETVFARASGSQQALIGLVLADLYGITSPAQALEQTAVVNNLSADLSQDEQAYAAAIACAAHIRAGQLQRASPECEDSEAMLNGVRNEFVRARVESIINFNALRRGAMDKAIEYSLRAEQSARAVGNSVLLATTYNSSGLTYSFSGLHAQALERFKLARELLGSQSERPLDIFITFNLGLAYRELGDAERALTAFKEGFDWAQSTNQPHRTFIAQIEMADALILLERAQEALELLRPAVADQETVRDPDSLMHALLAMGDAALHLGNRVEALESYERGLQLASQYANQRRALQLRLARISALPVGASALADAKALVAELRTRQPNDELDRALEVLAELELAAGDQAAANEHLLEARNLTEAARGREFARKVTMLEVANRLDRAEQEQLAAQLRERAQGLAAQRNLYLAGGAFLLLVLLIMLVLFDRYRRRQQAKNTQLQHGADVLERLVDERTYELEQQMAARMQSQQEHEEEQRLLQQELQESDKLRALGQLTGGVAHDFNNLLTVIGGAAELLDSMDLADSRRGDLIQAIQEATRSGGEINAGLLAYARRQQLRPELVNLDHFFDVSMSLFKRTVGDEIDLEVHAAPLTIQVDRGQLSTALINLLSNAREASAGRGTVRIDVQQAQESPPTVSIRVRDWGRGMSEREVEQAVEPFYSTKEATIATGLGLSRVYGFVQQTGGQMFISSELGVGTTVSLEFPAATADGLEPIPQVAAYVQPLKVMLVDDNEMVRKVVSNMLETMGHEVLAADDTSHALAVLAGFDPDLLLTDVLMPGELGGRELAQAVRNRKPDLPILMISGFAKAPELDFPLLRKPFSLAELRTAIGDLLSARTQPAAS